MGVRRGCIRGHSRISMIRQMNEWPLSGGVNEQLSVSYVGGTG